MACRPLGRSIAGAGSDMPRVWPGPGAGGDRTAGEKWLIGKIAEGLEADASLFEVREFFKVPDALEVPPHLVGKWARVKAKKVYRVMLAQWQAAIVAGGSGANLPGVMRITTVPKFGVNMRATSPSYGYEIPESDMERVWVDIPWGYYAVDILTLPAYPTAEQVAIREENIAARRAVGWIDWGVWGGVGDEEPKLMAFRSNKKGWGMAPGGDGVWRPAVFLSPPMRWNQDQQAYSFFKYYEAAQGRWQKVKWENLSAGRPSGQKIEVYPSWQFEAELNGWDWDGSRPGVDSGYDDSGDGGQVGP